jgi:phosphate transport system substrate-binding protein
MNYRIYFIFLVILVSCKKETNKESSPTKGEVEIFVDSNLRSIMDQQKEVFERNYPYAKLKLNYLDEISIIKKFLYDSTEIIILSRALDSVEIKFLNNRKLIPRHYELARTAIAFVSNKSSLDSTFSFESINHIAMDSLNDKNLLVIENANSGISQYLLKVFHGEKFSKNVFAAENKDKIIEHLNQSPTSIACFDWSEISDSDDPKAKAILSKVKLLAISRPKDSVQHGFILPYQYNLQDKLYPFCRDIYFISRSGKSDLGLGFASFVAGEIGQKIMLKAGLLPKYQSERLIELKNKDFKVIK